MSSVMDCGNYIAIDYGHPFIYIPKSGAEMIIKILEEMEVNDDIDITKEIKS